MTAVMSLAVFLTAFQMLVVMEISNILMMKRSDITCLRLLYDGFPCQHDRIRQHENCQQKCGSDRGEPSRCHRAVSEECT